MIYKRGCDKNGLDRTCSKCGEHASCGVYWYKFMWQGKLVRESTKQRNDKVARNMESAHRTSLAKGEVGIRDKKVIPTLAAFMTDSVLPWAKGAFAGKQNTHDWYRNEARVLSEYKPLAGAPLDGIKTDLVSGFVAWRIKQGRQIATVNSSIRMLRRTLNLAVEWEIITSAPKIKVLTGERRREHVVTPEEEATYLGIAPEPLASIATILIESGLRPEECFRLRWENVRLLSGRNGALLVTHGKTAAARRVIPMTPRIRAIFEARWEAAIRPGEGWVFPAKRAHCGHVIANTIYEPHLKTIKDSGVRPFVLYSLRHTFLTRLGESGCDVWTLARIAGHSSTAMSSRYVHPSENAMLDAIERLGRHKSRHIEKQNLMTVASKMLVTANK
jgi:integrase